MSFHIVDSVLNVLDGTTDNVSDKNILDDIDSDCNIVKDMFNSNCQYYNEESFANLLQGTFGLKDSFSILHHNIRSIPKNFAKLQDYLECIDFKFSIIGISETWHTDVTCDLYKLDNYNCTNVYRCNRTGGGVSLYISKDIVYKERRDLKLTSDGSDYLFIEIDGRNIRQKHNVIIGIIYRPPNTSLPNFVSEISNLLSAIKTEKNHCI